MIKRFKIICSCSQRKEISDGIIVEEDPSIKTELSYEIKCPNEHEAYCKKYLTIKLPPGVKPDSNETGIFRSGE